MGRSMRPWTGPAGAGRCDELRRHLSFRNWLRAHPTQAAKYASLKLQLAQAYRDDCDVYTEAKTDDSLSLQAGSPRRENWRHPDGGKMRRVVDILRPEGLSDGQGDRA